MARIRLVVNPANDSEFAAAAREGLERGAADARDLEAGLRPRYPLVSVHPGITDDGTERWYAYRDGRWVNPSSQR